MVARERDDTLTPVGKHQRDELLGEAGFGDLRPPPADPPPPTRAVLLTRGFRHAVTLLDVSLGRQLPSGPMPPIAVPDPIVLRRGVKPDAHLIESELEAIIMKALPAHTYRSAPREWTWSRPSGLWLLNLVFPAPTAPGEPDRDPTMKARLHVPQGASSLNVCVRTTRREVDAALRFLVLVEAIDRHPDDPYPVSVDIKKD